MGHKVGSRLPRRCTAKKITEIFSFDSLKNKRCFLLGGGPSLTGFNFSSLKNEFTIGTNKTFAVFSPVINYSMDLKFYNYVSSPGQRHDQKETHVAWTKYDGYKVFLCPRENQIPVFPEDLYVVDRIAAKTISLDIEKGIFSAKNSGFGALMLAIAMGCKEIYLLGYDLKVDEEKTHHHSGYRNQDLSQFKRLLQRYKKSFEEFSESIEETGVKVVNLSRRSALRCFPKDDFGNVIKGTKT